LNERNHSLLLFTPARSNASTRRFRRICFGIWPPKASTLTALELRIEHYLRADYNARAHSALASGETPRSRYLADPRTLDPYTDEAALRAYFFVEAERTVLQL